MHIEYFHERKQTLEKLIDEVSRSLSLAPEGTLRVSNSNGRIQYYRRTDSDPGGGVYIRKQDRDLAGALAQKDYDIELLRRMQSEKSVINEFLNYHENSDADFTFKELNDYRKKLVFPRLISDDEFAENWKMEPFNGKSFRDDDLSNFFTKKGERVRSKSEIIIADMLYDNNIPYRYECPLYLASGEIRYPDFTLLNKHSRRLYYLEHMGMMDNAGYLRDFFRKLSLYSANDIVVGVNLFLTFESSMNPININDLRNTVSSIVNLFSRE